MDRERALGHGLHDEHDERDGRDGSALLPPPPLPPPSAQAQPTNAYAFDYSTLSRGEALPCVQAVHAWASRMGLHCEAPARHE